MFTFCSLRKYTTAVLVILYEPSENTSAEMCYTSRCVIAFVPTCIAVENHISFIITAVNWFLMKSERDFQILLCVVLS